MPNKIMSDFLNKMELTYFYERKTGETSGSGYIASSTWRGWRAKPKIDESIKNALIAAFDFLITRFERFLGSINALTRGTFENFHDKEIESLYKFLIDYNQTTIVHPAAIGDFNGWAYNSYAKILNLAYSHWCFRTQPISKKIQYEPSNNPELLHVLHVPLDTNVFRGINCIIFFGSLNKPSISIPQEGMGIVKSKQHYYQIQNYPRLLADQIPSTNFKGNTVSPLAFEASWGT